MTAKRFTLEYVRSKPNFWDNFCDLSACYLTCEDVLNLLNELHEENQQLKYKNEILSDELEQAKAVISKKWSEYLKKKDGVILND